MSAAITLPATLNRQFDLLERRLWHMDALVAASGGIGSLLLSYGFQFASDRLWDTPHLMRLLFAICGWGGFAVFAWRYGSRWVWGRPSIGALAMIVQKRYRRLGDRLLGIVELANPEQRPSDYSPELCRAAIAQVAGEASSFDFRQAAGKREARRYLIGFMILAAVVAILAGVAPAASWNALQRWFWPEANVARYTFVSIEELPDHMVVAQGEPFDITIALARNSYWRPRSAHSHFEGQAAAAAAIQNGSATFHFPGQTEARVLWLSVGDVTRSMRVEPAVRPDLRQLRARLELPAYLHYPPQEERIEGGSLAFLPGTTAVFTGETVRELASATLQGEKPLAVDGPRFRTTPMLLELERNAIFTWRDSLGLDGPGAVTVHLIPKEDEPPDIDVRGLEAAIAVLPEETVPIDLAATDDYGVQRLTLAWQRAAQTPTEPPGPVHEIKLAEGQPQAKALAGHYNFNAALLQIEPDTTIAVRGLAIDYYPDRQPASSPIYRIHVLSREEHARLVHDEFEKLLEQLEELTRRQEAILQSGKAVRAQDPQTLAGDKSAQKLGGQAQQQRETAALLRDLAHQMAGLLNEALRNPQIPQDTLKEFASHTEAMNELAANAMPTAAQSLESSKSDATQRPQKLDQALGQEQAILDAMREMQKQVNNSLESFMAQTLAARLRRAAGTERDIAASFQKMLPDTIGMTAEQLPAEPKEMLGGMTARHAEVTREAGRLQEEISRLFDRTSLKRYGGVVHEMEGQKTTDAMNGLGKLVENDIGAQSIDTARYWSDQFERWAARLSEKDNSQAQNGNAGGKPDAAELQAMLALMQLRQQQQQLREQTSALEEQKKTSDDYPTGTANAARQQSALGDAVRSLGQDASFPAPPEQLAPVGKAMDEASGLLAKPETGQPTYAAQTDAINLLDAIIEQEGQKSGQNASALLAMMGVGTTGGGNTSGGTTDKPNVTIPGSREGQSPEQRTVIQAGGADNSQLPGEFRDAIESYHRAIEQTPP